MRYADCHPDRKHNGRGLCRSCYKKSYDVAHRDKVAYYQKSYREAHRDERLVYNKDYHATHRTEEAAYRAAHRDERKDQSKAYYEAHFDKAAAYSKVYRAAHRDKVESYQKAYREAHRDELAAHAKAYRDSNRDKRSDRDRTRRAGDINYRIACNLRTRLTTAVRNKQKIGSAVRDLGCSMDQFRLYIGNQFELGMTWDNYGKWHLDHVQPLASFDLTDRQQFLDAANWLNYQPLWAKDNLAKGSNI